MSSNNNFSNIEYCSLFSTYTAGVINTSKLNLFSVANNNFSSSTGSGGYTGPIGSIGSTGFTGPVGYTGESAQGFVAVFGGKVNDVSLNLIYNGNKDSPTNTGITNKNIFILPVDCLLTYISYNIETPKSNATIKIIKNVNQLIKTITISSFNSGSVDINPYIFEKGSTCHILVENQIINDTNVILYFS
jgi:hypothetical protein